MWRWLHELEKDDFYVLSGPFRSGRQHPENLAGNLIIASILLIFFYGLMDVMVFYALYVTDVRIITIVIILNIFAFIAILFSFIFSFKNVYEKMRAMQYFVVTCVIQFTMYILFWPGIFTIINDQSSIDEQFITNLIYYIVGVHILGFLVFAFASFRMAKLLKRKKFHFNSYRARKREELENKGTASFINFVEIGASAFISIVVFFNLFPNLEVNTILIVSISLLIFFIMMFILPEQLMMVYCIKRFDNFQFTKNFDDEE